MTETTSDIVLCTLNSSWSHPSFGLRYLLANLGEWQRQASLLELTIDMRPVDAVEAILARAPRVLGLGVYVWNATETLELVTLLRAVAPDVVIVLGGPEVSHEVDSQELCARADYVVVGEGEDAFRELCGALLAGERPPGRIIPGGLPDLNALALPYSLYDETDCLHRVIYVEVSRGCPFACQFCLSALDTRVRAFDLERFLGEMQRLLDLGVSRFKFVDRTFNLKIPVSKAILDFFAARMRPGLFVHFEMIPDRLPDALRESIAGYPPGALQFEVGVQTLTPEVEARIGRRQDHDRLFDNLTFLVEKTGVHVHADLIVGLPGETWDTLASSFDQLWATGVHEIQVGILKRLRGAPIAQHTDAFQMAYSPYPPYEILRNRDLDFAQMQHLKRFARYWDLIVNSGHFITTIRYILSTMPSAFVAFSDFTHWLWEATGRVHKIALLKRAELLFDWATNTLDMPHEVVAGHLVADSVRSGRREPFGFLREHVDEQTWATSRSAPRVDLPQRQARHHGADISAPS